MDGNADHDVGWPHPATDETASAEREQPEQDAVRVLPVAEPGPRSRICQIAHRLTECASHGRDAITLAHTTGDTVQSVVKLALQLTAKEALDACRERGVVVRSERELAGHPGSHHRHLGLPSRRGTLELSELHGQVWVQVHPRRDAGWATGLARELAALRSARSTHS